MIEILYFSNYRKQSREFLIELAEDLNELNCECKINFSSMQMTVGKFKIITIPKYSDMIYYTLQGNSGYFINATWYSDNDFFKNIGNRFKGKFQQIKGRNELMEFLKNQGINDNNIFRNYSILHRGMDSIHKTKTTCG